MRQLVLGRLKWRPADFYHSTLADIYDALRGYGEAQDEAWQWNRYNTRDICFYVIQPYLQKGSSIKRPEDLWKLPMDDEIRKMRHKILPKVEILKPDGTVIK